MRILFVGDLNEHTRTFQRLKVLQEIGHSVTALPTRHVPTLPGLSPKPGIYPRVRNKLAYPLDPERVNRAIAQAAREPAYDLLWVEKALMLHAATLRRFHRQQPHAVLAYYSEDDMYARHNQSVFFRSALPLYDIVFTTKSYNVAELPSIGAQRVVFVGKAYGRQAHRPMQVSEEDRARLGSDVIFIGSYERERAEDLLYLAELGIPVRVWGNGWNTWRDRHANLMIEGRPLYGDDYVRALCSSKIALCFLRKQNRDLQTDRTMEIPAMGVFMLAERTAEHQQLFTEGVEAEFFATAEELGDKVRYYLEHEAERQRIAQAGYQRCITSGYSHHDRLATMLEQIDALSAC